MSRNFPKKLPRLSPLSVGASHNKIIRYSYFECLNHTGGQKAKATIAAESEPIVTTGIGISRRRPR